MADRRKLLAAGVLAIVAAALAPHALRAWREHRLRGDVEQSAVYYELKQRELACLQRLTATGLPKGMNVEREIERCRQMGVDPATGEPVKPPRFVSVP